MLRRLGLVSKLNLGHAFSCAVIAESRSRGQPGAGLAAIRGMRDVESEAFCGAGHLIHELVFAGSGSRTKTGRLARTLCAATQHLDDGDTTRTFQVMVRGRSPELAAGQ